jgi:diacylglycerol kinase (ATP)
MIQELKRCGFQPRLFSDRDRMNDWMATESTIDRLHCIVAAGGDGTIGSLVNRFPQHPMATLPLGTENLLAKYLKIPRSGKLVARLIADNRRRDFDTGILGETRFTLMASIGFDAEVVHRTDAARTGPISKWNYVQPILAALRNYQHPRLRVFVDGASEPIEGVLVVAVNIPGYAFGLKVAESADGSDGQLDLRIFQRGSAFQMMRYCLKVATASHEFLADVQCVQAKRVVIESKPSAPVQMDGDPAGLTPVTLSVDPGSLTMLIPAE